MKNKNMYIYAKLSPENNGAVFSGITFADFIECASVQVENLLLLKSGYFSDKRCHNFELLEGKDDITKLAHEDIYNYGDFCFVDYISPASVQQLTGNEISELLYMAHLLKPLKSPFLDTLQNKYVYLSHDDGWYCKLYCKEQQVLNSILRSKLLNSLQRDFCDTISPLPDELINRVTELSTRGLLIQINSPIQQTKMLKKSKIASIKLYEVGEAKNMDCILNNADKFQAQLSYEVQLTTTPS